MRVSALGTTGGGGPLGRMPCACVSIAANWLAAGVGKLLPKGLLPNEKGAAETMARHDRPTRGSEIL